MNVVKAREFYSAYYEGTLESGLRQAFERSLRTDAQVQAEYHHFVKSLERLGELRAEVIDVPFDLNDRIQARLDLEAWQTQQKAKPAFWLTWRTALIGGVASLALLAGLIGVFTSSGNGALGTASLFGSPGVKSEAPKIEMVEGVTRLRFAPIGAATVTISNAESGDKLSTIPLNGQKLDSPLQNERAEATLLRIDAGRNFEAILLALPGRRPIQPGRGEGTLSNLALRLADTLRRPVVLDLRQPDRKLAWDLTGVNTADMASAKLAALDLTLDVHDSGLVHLSD